MVALCLALVLAGLCRAPAQGDRPVSLYAVAARYAAHDTIALLYLFPGCRTWPLFSAEPPRIWAVSQLPDTNGTTGTRNWGCSPILCATTWTTWHSGGTATPKRRRALCPSGALPVDNLAAVCHGASPSGALARLRSCLFCRNDGYHTMIQAPRGTVGLFAAPPLPWRCF